MMDIEKLIERLYKHNKDWGEGRTIDFFEVFLDCKAAFTALSALQVENEKLRADLEQMKAERDAAIKDIWVPKWISCKNGENCSFVSAITGMPDCAGCDNWEWRGKKED